jgi:hypothetical protein
MALKGQILRIITKTKSSKTKPMTKDGTDYEIDFFD